jgi:hypothetical protein
MATKPFDVLRSPLLLGNYKSQFFVHCTHQHHPTLALTGYVLGVMKFINLLTILVTCPTSAYPQLLGWAFASWDILNPWTIWLSFPYLKRRIQGITSFPLSISRLT